MRSGAYPRRCPSGSRAFRSMATCTFREQSDFFPARQLTNQIPRLQLRSIRAGGIGKLAISLSRYDERSQPVPSPGALGRRGRRFALPDRFYPPRQSGSLTNNAASESQTLGQYGNRYTVGIDEAYIRWNTNTLDQLSFSTANFGRMPESVVLADGAGLRPRSDVRGRFRHAAARLGRRRLRPLACVHDPGRIPDAGSAARQPGQQVAGRRPDRHQPALQRRHTTMCASGWPTTTSCT